MSITKITYLFDIDGFRETFGPISQQLEVGITNELREKAQHLASNNLVLWKLLDQLGYFIDDFEKEGEFDINERVKFWILALISSFCKNSGSIPLNSISIAKLLKELLVEDEEIVRKLQWGRPLGGLLLPQIEYRAALDRDDSKWPYWCKSYGSLGWLARSEVDYYINLITNRKSEGHSVSDERRLETLLSTLNEATDKNLGFLLGESA